MAIHHENILRTQTLKKTDIRHSGIDHWHQRAEFVYILDGECRIRVGKEERLCLPGDLAAVRGGQIHSLRNEPGCVLYISTFDPAFLFHFFPEPRFPQSFIPLELQRAAGLETEISRLFGSICREWTEEAPFYETLMRADILRLYTLLVRHFEDGSPRDEQSLARLRQFQTALEFIAAHYAENITLSDIAGAISYNPTYVSTLFVTCAGVNFKTYLDSYRIKIAVDLLRSTQRTVSDIAAQCGYDNVRTFNNTFRRVTGQSPSQLRRSNL